jgi:hypothetical protein
MIVNIFDYNMAFQNAHRALLVKHGRIPSPNHMTILQKLWQQEYGIRIIVGNCRFEKLDFATQQDATLFLLRWS